MPLVSIAQDASTIAHKSKLKVMSRKKLNFILTSNYESPIASAVQSIIDKIASFLAITRRRAPSLRGTKQSQHFLLVGSKQSRDLLLQVAIVLIYSKLWGMSLTEVENVRNDEAALY